MFYSRDFSSLPIFHVDISKEISDVLNPLFGKYENCIALENYHGRRKLALIFMTIKSLYEKGHGYHFFKISHCLLCIHLYIEIEVLVY